MRCVIVGLGVQGKKRLAEAGRDVVATVDPQVKTATRPQLTDVPLSEYDAALICTPDAEKLQLVDYLIRNRKHVLVEKPLLADNGIILSNLNNRAQLARVALYTGYNHRFEPHIRRLRRILRRGTLGSIYRIRMFYGNGTAQDVAVSPWRDTGLGVLSDLGSHLLDLYSYLLGNHARDFALWRVDSKETLAPDYACFGTRTGCLVQLEATFLSWRNTFNLEVLGEDGSARINGLCKWGPAELTTHQRVRPSGKPIERTWRLERPDPTWRAEYRYFARLCAYPRPFLKRDLWLNSVLNGLGKQVQIGRKV